MSYNKVATDFDRQKLKDIIKNHGSDITDKDVEKALQATDDLIHKLENIQQLNKQEEKAILCATRLVSIALLTIIMLPFSITSIYYAYTDKSCVNLKAGKLYITLKDFLAVQGISILASYILTIGMLCFGFNSLSDIKVYFQHPLIKALAVTNRVFSLSWLILGAIIFWSLIDNSKCDDSIYNYMYALLIIMFIFTLISSIQILQEKN